MKPERILYWAARILVILFAAFISIFSLDVFGEGYGFPGLLLALFMHMLPTIGVVIVLLIAWKWEFTGGVIFLLLAIAFTFFFDTYEDVLTLLTISGPPFIAGSLFVWHKMLTARR